MSVTNVALALLTSDTWLITRKDALEIFRSMREGRTWAEAVFWLGVLLFVHGVLFLGDVSFGSLYTWLLMVVLNVGGPHSLVTLEKRFFIHSKLCLANFFSPVGDADPFPPASDDAEPTIKSPLYCYNCDTLFNYRLEFAQHRLQVHNDPKPFKCYKCKKAFTAFPSLTRHKQSCENTFMVFCPVCNRGFHRKDYLNDHLKGQHKYKYTRMYNCKVCGKTFNFKSWLLTHKQTCRLSSPSTSGTSHDADL